jgi:hypothetical protein
MGRARLRNIISRITYQLEAASQTCDDFWALKVLIGMQIAW